MLERFYPTKYYNSVWDIDFELLYINGVRGIIFDIDNTLVPHGMPATTESVELFSKIHDIGIKTCLISNNDEPRVAPFGYAMHTPFVFDAKKPSRRNYIKAMEIMGTDKTNTIFVGDQIFTDVYGANRTGIPSYLVKQIDKKEEIQIVLKRYLEKIVLNKWKNSVDSQR